MCIRQQIPQVWLNLTFCGHTESTSTAIANMAILNSWMQDGHQQSNQIKLEATVTLLCTFTKNRLYVQGF